MQSVRRFGLAMAMLIAGRCAIAIAGHGAYMVPRCHSAVGVPCAPKRETYCYFPTNWRRWPTEQVETAPEAPPEAVPTPAEPTPGGEPAAPEALPAPATKAPEAGAPAVEAPKSPLAPPFEEGPVKPPFGETTLPPPFEDAPPLPPVRAREYRSAPEDRCAP